MKSTKPKPAVSPTNNTDLTAPAHMANQATSRIGLLGGTFDPIHCGHIEPAKQTAAWLGLDELFILPAHIPPHKNTTSANAKQREHMVNLVCHNEPLFSLDSRELKRHTPSYTLTSLQEVKKSKPHSQVYFIIGMDSLLNFTTWYKWQEILKLCHLVVNFRPEHPLNDINSDTQKLLDKHWVKHLFQAQQQQSGCILFHQNDSYNISSTTIRAQIKKQQLNKELLPAYILDYIIAEKLYQQ